MLVPSMKVMPSATPRSWARSSSPHTPRWAQRINICAARDQGPRSAGMARHLAPFSCRQRMAESVRRRSWGGVLPLGRHASISGSSLIQCASDTIARSSFQEGQNACHHKQFKLEQTLVHIRASRTKPCHMTAQAQSPHLTCDLGRFLYAQIGQEENGTPLTILSALARLGLDPWQEAARLAKLPKDEAARELASLIARLPRPIEFPDRRTIASKLAELLPKPTSGASGHAQRDWTTLTLWAVLGSILLLKPLL